MVTLALRTAAPDGSVTVPVNWPFWICATAPKVNSRVHNATKQQRSLVITPILPKLFDRFETAIDRTCLSSRPDNSHPLTCITTVASQHFDVGASTVL